MAKRGMVDEGLPWHILFQREGLWHVAETHDDMDELVGALVNMPDPGRVRIRHVPSGREGSGRAFLDSFDRGDVAEMMDSSDQGINRLMKSEDGEYRPVVVEFESRDDIERFVDSFRDWTHAPSIPLYQLRFKVDPDGIAFQVDDGPWSRPFGVVTE